MKREGVTIRDAKGQTSKDMGANVECDFERGSLLHTFALSKDRNNMYNNKIIKGMKKMIVALVAMLVMATSVNAQSDNSSASFDRMASYLELTIDQVESVRTAMAQFDSSMAALYQNKEASKGQEVWEKIRTRHMATMKKILNDKQYDKYVMTFDLTVKNTAERLAEQQMASK